jgi:hypothetical protein
MDRPTKKVTTKSKHKLVLKEWLTKAERLSIEQAGAKNIEGIYEGGEKVRMRGFGVEAAARAVLDAVVVSVDERKDNDMVKYVMDEMPEWEADEIYNEVNKVTDKGKVKKK